MRGRLSRIREFRLVKLLRGVFTEEPLAGIDLFDQFQLTEVIAVCRYCGTLSAAGRKLFQASRQSPKMGNDADRLRRYLTRFELHRSWCGQRPTMTHCRAIAGVERDGGKDHLVLRQDSASTGHCGVVTARPGGIMAGRFRRTAAIWRKEAHDQRLIFLRREVLDVSNT
jgi:hypothetical protein